MSVGFAGCAALQGESTPVETDYQPDTSDHLRVAVGQLNTAALSVSSFQSSETPREATFDASGPQDRIERAREAIHTAETNASGDDVNGDIEVVRSYADAVEGTVTAVDRLVTASDRLRTARETLDTDRVDTDTAATTLDAATTASSAAVEAHDKAETALEAADGGRLRELGAQYEAMQDGLDTLSGFVIGVDGLATGYDGQVAGVDALQTAQNRIDTGRFDDARTAFATARQSFAGSATAFADALSRAAESVVSDIEYGEDRSRSLTHLTAGYMSLLGGRERVIAAEQSIDEAAYEEARTPLSDGRDRAATALSGFDDGAAILPEKFNTEFETARSRAQALDSLATGYLALLDAHDRIGTVESQFEADEFDAARETLRKANDDAVAADERFAAGQEASGTVFAPKFETARTRANATESLADGYLTLLDAREHLQTGETAFLDRDYGSATPAFERASETSRTAETTFEEKAQTDEGELFRPTFDRALRRARAVTALSEGYAGVVTGREQIAGGIDHLEDRGFTSATNDFEAASETIDEADETFTEGRDPAQGAFAAEFARALCRVGHLRTAVEHFRAASEAGNDGERRRANRKRDAGSEALERVSDC
jgi:hypothetical protein